MLIDLRKQPESLELQLPYKYGDPGSALNRRHPPALSDHAELTTDSAVPSSSVTV